MNTSTWIGVGVVAVIVIAGGAYLHMQSKSMTSDEVMMHDDTSQDAMMYDDSASDAMMQGDTSADMMASTSDDAMMAH
jgi:hypothetical protein